MKCLDNKENIDNEIGLKPLKLRKLLPYKYYKILYILVGKYVIIRICPQLYFLIHSFHNKGRKLYHYVNITVRRNNHSVFIPMEYYADICIIFHRQ